VDLRCEYMTEPLGVDAAQPRLSWKLESRWRGQKQTAYQVLVAASEKMLKNDRATCGTAARSRRISPFMWSIPAGRWPRGPAVTEGAGLGRRGRGRFVQRGCTWIWPVDAWPTGSQWISMPGKDDDKAPQPAPLFRKSFVLARPRSAHRLYICGLGYHELRLNGEKVGDHVLDPAFTRTTGERSTSSMT